jgi:hypothetical protein
VRAFLRASFAMFVLASWSSGCAHYETVAVGEALTVGDGRVSPALAVEAAAGTGSSREGGSVFMQTRGRGIVGPVRQQVAGFAGVSNLRWIGQRAPLWLHLDVGPGLEHYSGTIFFEAIAHARIGTGFVLGQVVEPYSPINPWGPEAVPVARPLPRAPWREDLMAPTPQIVRRRILLTLALGGDVDARFTRDPLYVASLMIGIAHVEEIRRSP